MTGFFRARQPAASVALAASWRVFAFLAAAGIRTLFPGGEAGYAIIKQVAKLGLTLTLFLIGSGLSRDALKTVGFRPMVQGVILWVIVATAGYGAVRFLAP